MRLAAAKGLHICNYSNFTKLVESKQLLFFTSDLLNASPALGKIYIAPGFRRKDVLALSAALFTAAGHRLAGSLYFAARAVDAAIPDCQITQNDCNKITGLIKGEQVIIGKPGHVSLPGSANWANNKMIMFSHLRQSPLFIIKEGRLCGALGVQYQADEETIEALRSQGLNLAMFSRLEELDDSLLAEIYAIEKVYPVASDQDKTAVLEGLRSAGTNLTLVLQADDHGCLNSPGNTINITVGKSSAASGIDIYSDRVSKLPEVVHLAHISRAKTRQSIFTLKAFNAAGMALAAAGRLSVMGAAVYLNITSLIVSWLARRTAAVKKKIAPLGGPVKPDGVEKKNIQAGGKPKLTLLQKPANEEQGEWSRLDSPKVLQLFNTNPEGGLSAEEVKRRLASHGPNRLVEAKPLSLAAFYLPIE